VVADMEVAGAVDGKRRPRPDFAGRVNDLRVDRNTDALARRVADLIRRTAAAGSATRRIGAAFSNAANRRTAFGRLVDDSVAVVVFVIAQSLLGLVDQTQPLGVLVVVRLLTRRPACAVAGLHGPSAYAVLVLAAGRHQIVVGGSVAVIVLAIACLGLRPHLPVTGTEKRFEALADSAAALSAVNAGHGLARRARARFAVAALDALTLLADLGLTTKHSRPPIGARIGIVVTADLVAVFETTSFVRKAFVVAHGIALAIATERSALRTD
jgi:hypothetical protein